MFERKMWTAMVKEIADMDGWVRQKKVLLLHHLIQTSPPLILLT